MLSLSASSISTLPDGAVSDKSLCMSALNSQLMVNAADCGHQPSDVLVSETVPQDFVEINDSSEIQREHVENRDDCFESYAPVTWSVTAVEHDSHTVGESASATTHMEPNIVTSCRKKTSSSPIFNHQCQFAIPIPVSSSPSLFDDDEEKRLHQRSIDKNLLSVSEKHVATASHICTDVSQPSPSVLSRKLGVNVLADHENETNRYQMNVDHQQPTLPSLSQSTVDERGLLQTMTEAKFRDSCDCSAQMKLNGVLGSNKILPSELAIQLHGADDGVCCMQVLDVHNVPAEDISVACAIDTLAVSATRTINEQNLLAAAMKLSKQHITSATCISSDVASDFQQPLSKKRRHDRVYSTSSHSGSSDSPPQDHSKFFCTRCN